MNINYVSKYIQNIDEVGTNMQNINNSKTLRELMRLLERKLGVLGKNEGSSGSMTLAQCHAIVEIGRTGNISLNELSDILNLDNSTISRTINNLVNAGMVIRETDAKDRRYIVIRLTDSGNEIFKEIEENMGKYFEKVYESIPKDKTVQVVESLEILLDAIKEKF